MQIFRYYEYTAKLYTRDERGMTRQEEITITTESDEFDKYEMADALKKEFGVYVVKVFGPKRGAAII